MSVMAAAGTWIERTGGFARRRGERLHGRAAQRRSVRPWPLALGFVLVMVLCCALVWVRLQVVRTGYELSTARRVEQRLGHEERELAIELATITSPRPLERLARSRLGMQPPEPGQIINVR